MSNLHAVNNLVSDQLQDIQHLRRWFIQKHHSRVIDQFQSNR